MDVSTSSPVHNIVLFGHGEEMLTVIFLVRLKALMDTHWSYGVSLEETKESKIVCMLTQKRQQQQNT